MTEETATRASKSHTHRLADTWISPWEHQSHVHTQGGGGDKRVDSAEKRAVIS